jgi:hypothetical protein
MGRLESDSDCSLAAGIPSARTHAIATHVHAHDLAGNEGRNHREKYISGVAEW